MILRKFFFFPHFNPKKYFFFTEYIISDLKNVKEQKEKNNSVKSFQDIDNVLSTRRTSVDVNKLIIQNNDFKSIRIKSNMILNMKQAYLLKLTINSMNTYTS